MKVTRFSALAAVGLPIFVMLAGSVSTTTYVGNVEIIDDVDQTIKDASTFRERLLKEAGAADFEGKPRITLTWYGGLPPGYLGTVQARREADGGWLLEKILAERNADYTGLNPGRLTRVKLGAKPSREFDRLLADFRLRFVKRVSTGGCTDQPIEVLDVAWKTRSLVTVRTACPPSDATSAISEALFKAAP